ncbi:MAG: lactate/malate dehydrogenase family protein [Anaerolineae bacterium]|nr:lactate/malate dehydrogenase family protein [Phycisphaerae bacterium]
MKVSIIGAGGRVGSNAAFALQCAGIVSEIHLLDTNEGAARGEALDLLHGTSLAGDQRIYAGDYDRCADSDLICITAGLRRKPDESRLHLINRNVELFKQILDSLLALPLRDETTLFVVSNPVDLLTRLAIDHLRRDSSRVIGLGTQLDTARFRSLIALETNLPASQIKALIIGEHGDSMVPTWSSATVAGFPLLKLPGFGIASQQRVFERTKNSGAEVIALKGGAGWAVGLSIAEVIHAMALNQPKVLPLSTQLGGEYGISGTCISVPTMIGKPGIFKRIEVELWPREFTGLQSSARLLDEGYSKITGARPVQAVAR